MKKIKGILQGKKTYVTAAIGLLTAVGAYLTGDMELQDAIRTAWVAVMAIFLRNGIDIAATK